MVTTLPIISTDIIVHSADKDVLAAVEIKNTIDLSPMIAASLRDAIIEDAPMNRYARFFFVLSQEIGYLWDQRSLPVADDALPAVEFPMAQVVAHYLPSAVDQGRLAGSDLEYAVIPWLWDLAQGREPRPKEPEDALGGTDFLRLIRGGWVDLGPDR